ncbi:MAG: helix-turn-helix transcriptional regulator [Clostridia bacterium]|nr:helix-turn-helix transcriptional regulator [Clostridia bacterium]
MLGDRLRSLRLANKFTQKDVAHFLGIDRTSYTYYETNTSVPSVRNLYKLSKIYNVTVDYLLGDEETKSTSDSAMAVVSDYDAFVSLTKEERLLISCFRLIRDDAKKEAVEFVENLAENNPVSPNESLPSLKKNIE